MQAPALSLPNYRTRAVGEYKNNRILKCVENISTSDSAIIGQKKKHQPQNKNYENLSQNHYQILTYNANPKNSQILARAVFFLFCCRCTGPNGRFGDLGQRQGL